MLTKPKVLGSSASPKLAVKHVVERVVVTFGQALLLPVYLMYRGGLLGFATVGHALSLVPGRAGIGIRRAWYEMSLEACGRGLVVEFLAAFRTSRTRVGNHCHIGLGSWIGWAEIGDDVITGNHVTILSGRKQHGRERFDVPMRLQEGVAEKVRIGSDVWVGSRVIIAAEVSRGTIIGAGAVVTKTFPELSILAGVPAQVIGSRQLTRPDAQRV